MKEISDDSASPRDSAHANGVMFVFCDGSVRSGPHVLYQDFVVPTGQISDGTSNTIMFAEVVPASSGSHGVGDLGFDLLV